MDRTIDGEGCLPARMAMGMDVTRQALVDTDSTMIIARDLSNRASDSPHLSGLVALYPEMMGCDPKELSADAGYYSEAILARLRGW